MERTGDGDVLSVAARPNADGTAVSVVIDRRGTFVLTGVISSLAMFFAVLFAAFALGPEAPALGFGGLVVGIGGVLAAARGYWASSTRKVREKMGVVMDAIGQTLRHPETQTSGLTTVRDGAAAPMRDARVVGDAEVTGV